MRPPAWTLLLVLLAAPAASAAPATIAVQFPPLPLLEPGAERAAEGTLTYRHEGTSPNATEVTITAASGPAWLLARVEPARLAIVPSDPAGVAAAGLRLTVMARADAAALAQHTLQLRVEAAANPPLEPVNATADVVVRVAYVGGVEAEALEPSVRGRPGEPLSVALRLANRGNGPARVTLEPVGAPEALRVVPPPSLVLEAGADRVVNLSMLPEQPGRFPLLVRVGDRHAFDPSHAGPGDGVQVEVVVQPAGMPWPGAVPGLLAAACAAALRRRQRLG